MTKRCKGCAQWKPLDEFYKHKTNRDGRAGSCRDCTKARARERYANDSAFREAQRAYKAQRLESGDYWAYTYTLRCEKIGITPVIEPFSRQDVIDEYGDRCFYCQHGAFEELDHFRCVAQGGLHTLDNARPSCTRCNRSKRDSNPLEFISHINDPEWQSSTSKVCNKCAERKPMDDFYNAKATRDGKYGACKKCHLARVHERKKERYAHDPEFRERCRDYGRRYYHENRKAQQPEPV